MVRDVPAGAEHERVPVVEGHDLPQPRQVPAELGQRCGEIVTPVIGHDECTRAPGLPEHVPELVRPQGGVDRDEHEGGQRGGVRQDQRLRDARRDDGQTLAGLEPVDQRRCGTLGVDEELEVGPAAAASGVVIAGHECDGGRTALRRVAQDRCDRGVENRLAAIRDPDRFRPRRRRGLGIAQTLEVLAESGVEVPDTAFLVPRQGHVGLIDGLQALLQAGQRGGVLVEDATEVSELGRVRPPLACFEMARRSSGRSGSRDRDRLEQHHVHHRCRVVVAVGPEPVDEWCRVPGPRHEVGEYEVLDAHRALRSR